MSFGISVNNLPEQSTTVPSQEQFDGHGTSDKQSVVLDFMSSRPVNKIINDIFCTEFFHSKHNCNKILKQYFPF